jgi:hypothetical protein
MSETENEDALIDKTLAELDLATVPPRRTLEALDKSRRPKVGTVCERCPNSVWFASPAELRCYCRIMFLITWSTKEPNQITNCDGEFLGQG